MIVGWAHPQITDAKGEKELKPKVDWTKVEDETTIKNSCALNAIFNGVDKNIFNLINTCVFAKKAWNILAVAHKGTSEVKMSRLQLLVTKFENLKMQEDETITDLFLRSSI